MKIKFLREILKMIKRPNIDFGFKYKNKLYLPLGEALFVIKENEEVEKKKAITYKYLKYLAKSTMSEEIEFKEKEIKLSEDIKITYEKLEEYEEMMNRILKIEEKEYERTEEYEEDILEKLNELNIVLNNYDLLPYRLLVGGEISYNNELVYIKDDGVLSVYLMRKVK